MEDCKKDINAVGERVNKIQMEQAAHNERIKINKENIGDLWQIINVIREEIKITTKSINDHAISVGKQINKGILWGIGIIAVPIILILIQSIIIQKSIIGERKNGRTNISKTSGINDDSYNTNGRIFRSSRGTKWKTEN